MPKTLKAVYKYAAQNFGNTIRVYPAQAYVQTTIRNISAVSISYGESNNPNSNGNDPGSFTVLLSGKTAVQPGSLKGVYVKPTTVVATERPLVEIEMEVAL